MRMLFATVALAALAACGSPEPEPAPVETPVAAVPEEPALPAPDEQIFSAAFAAACPSAPRVSTALCRSQGLTGDGFVCQFGLGNDEYRRNSATLVPADGEWTVADPANACDAAGDA
jgi:hypothetical protein